MMTRIIILATAAVSAAFAQQWEFGGMGGGGFLNSVGVTAPSGTATAGFSNSAAFGGYVGYNSSKLLGGEIHYDYIPNSLRIASGGSEATFSGNSQAIHYDVVFHTSKRGSKVQLFASAGGGMMIYRGTGTEHAVQALSTYGYFTKTQEVKPMGTVSAGVKFKLAPRVSLRTEIRDFITPFPQQVISPPSGVHYGSILNSLVPMVGISIDM